MPVLIIHPPKTIWIIVFHHCTVLYQINSGQSPAQAVHGKNVNIVAEQVAPNGDFPVKSPESRRTGLIQRLHEN
jgi:hypothetical protein